MNQRREITAVKAAEMTVELAVSFGPVVLLRAWLRRLSAGGRAQP